MLRRIVPQRTCEKEYKNYKSYKQYLKEDFSGRCGYCDITEFVLGKVFQIDHFAPGEKFPDLECVYSNMVYTCPSCNRAKWNDWPMDKANPSYDKTRGYVDPCDKEYDVHLGRKECGTIEGKTSVGIYMRHKLKLNALKHRYLWLIDIAHHQCEEVAEFLQKSDKNNQEIDELNKKFNELCIHFFNYHKIVRKLK